MTIHMEHLGDFLTFLLYVAGGMVALMIVMMAVVVDGLIGNICRTIFVVAALGTVAVAAGFVGLQ